MGLQINTNVAALNAYRNLSGTQSSMQTSLERLSSGLRINRAADDAAGLAISEKLRSQVSGLNQAQANAQDGVSLIQTAEGALNEVHSILQRVRTLAVQSASDTNTDSDRAAIQKEVTALVEEVNSTTQRTQFNGMNLLDGTFNQSVAKSLQIGANAGQEMKFNIKAMDAAGLGIGSAPALSAQSIAAAATVATTATVNKGRVEEGTYTIAAGAKDVTLNGTKVGTVAADNRTVTFDNGAEVTFGAALAAADTFSFNDKAVAGAGLGGSRISDLSTNLRAGTYAVGGAAAGSAVTQVIDGKTVTVGTLTTTTQIDFNDGTSIKLATGGAFAPGALTVADTFPAGGPNPSQASIDLSSKQGAQAAIKALDGAIKVVSDQRADLGALQNRLDHTVKNLGVSAENLAASESRIRDTDMAKEMTNFTRSQILQQAGVSMLAQANQSSQSVLKLLG